MKNYKNIQEIISEWGEKNRKLPARNPELKSEILSKVPQTFSFRENARAPKPWLSMAFAVFALFVFFGQNIFFLRTPVYNTAEVGVARDGAYEEEFSAQYSAPTVANKMMYPYPYNQGVPITDTRELMKQSYYAEIKTTKVVDTARKIEFAVRGVGGRIDGSSSGDDYGNVSFSIPEDKLDVLREEFKSLSLEKLFDEQLNSENLLPQKQSIEQQEKDYLKSLADAKKQKSQLQANRNQYSQSFYEEQLRNLDAQIKSYQDSLDYLKREDKNLTENVATVTGNVSLSKISWWGIADEYVPGALLAWVFVLGAIVSYYRFRVKQRIFVG